MTHGEPHPFEPRAVDWEARVRDSFARRPFMRHLGAGLASLRPGRVVIEVDFDRSLTQQHGFFHAGVTSSIADSAGGYAGFSLFPPDSRVPTVEYKMTLINPARGERLRAIGTGLEVDGEPKAAGEDNYQFVEDEDCGNVARLAVLEQARGKGLAKLLLREGFATHAAAGRTGTILHVDTNNPTPALDLYTSVGMEAVLVIDVWRLVVPT